MVAAVTMSVSVLTYAHATFVTAREKVDIMQLLYRIDDKLDKMIQRKNNE